MAGRSRNKTVLVIIPFIFLSLSILPYFLCVSPLSRVIFLACTISRGRLANMERIHVAADVLQGVAHLTGLLPQKLPEVCQLISLVGGGCQCTTLCHPLHSHSFHPLSAFNYQRLKVTLRKNGQKPCLLC